MSSTGSLRALACPRRPWKFLPPMKTARGPSARMGHSSPCCAASISTRKANRRDIRETIDRLRRYIEDLTVSQESAIVLQDEINSREAAKANRTIYMLSIVAAIFLPLTFVTGLLGINVGGIPGADSARGFSVTVGALAAVLVVQIIVFRKLKWL